MRRKLGLEEAMARSVPAATKPAQPATLQSLCVGSGGDNYSIDNLYGRIKYLRGSPEPGRAPCHDSPEHGARVELECTYEM